MATIARFFYSFTLLGLLSLAGVPASALMTASIDDRVSKETPTGFKSELLPSDLHNPKLVSKLHQHPLTPYLWLKDARLTSNGAQLLQKLKEASLHYSGSLPYRLNSLLRQIHYLPSTKREQQQLDFYLSDAFFSLMKDIIAGRLLPNQNERDHPAIPIYNQVRTKRLIPISVERIIHQWLDENTLSDIVKTKLAPQHPAYKALGNSLNYYIQLSQFDHWPTFNQSQTNDIDIKISDLTNKDHQWLSHRLALLGDLPQEYFIAPKTLQRDFNFSSSHPVNQLIDLKNQRTSDQTSTRYLTKALKHFQQRNNLSDTGQLDATTLALLNRSPEQHIQKIAINMNRWRYLPDNLGRRYIMTNMADYSLSLIEQDEEQLGMKVIIGKANRRTPILVQSLRTLVLNPTWAIPPRIARENFLPYAFRNPKSLTSQGIEIVRGSGRQRKVFEANSLSWETLDLNRFPYRLEQKPGKRNILGEVKFPLNNEYAIYLHDTSEPELFNKSKRALSSGCIRVEKPRALTEALLKYNKGWNSRRIAKAHKRRKNYYVSLKDPVPVYLMYWTSWVDSQGKIQFREDVYHRDTPKRYVSWHSEPMTIAHLEDE